VSDILGNLLPGIQDDLSAVTNRIRLGIYIGFPVSRQFVDADISLDILKAYSSIDQREKPEKLSPF
jgi:hypothetical protein